MSEIKKHTALHAATRYSLECPWLDPNKVKLDQRDKASLFTMLARLSDQFWFYNEHNQQDGDWRSFFESDLTAILVMLSSDDKQQEFDNIFTLLVHRQTGNPIGDQRLLLDAYEKLAATVLQLDRFYQIIYTRFNANPFQTYLQDLIWSALRMSLDGIGFCMNTVFKEVSSADKYRYQEIIRRLESLSGIWDNSVAFQNGSTPKTTDILDYYEQFYSRYHQLVKKARIALKEQKIAGNTQPHIGLLLAFLRLYKHQQELANGLVERHLDFYYRDVLKFSPQRAKQDQAFVLFSLFPEFKNYLLKANTQLSAGEDEEGNAIIFSTNEALLINNAELESCQVIQFDKKDKKTSQAQLPDLRKALVNQESGVIQTINLGERLEANKTKEDAVIPQGLSFNSPAFYMEAGVRTLNIMWTKAVPSSDKLEFNITTPDGWFKVPSGQIKKETKVTDKDNKITKTYGYKITLNMADPAWVSYDEDIHEPGFSTSWPILRLSWTASINWGYDDSYLKPSFTGEVNGFQNLYLYTPDGEVSPGAWPIYPFGSAPKSKSDLIIGAYEPFLKKGAKATLTLEWDNPLSQEDFKKHYGAYRDYLNQGITPIDVLYDRARQRLKLILDNLSEQEKVRFKNEIKTANDGLKKTKCIGNCEWKPDWEESSLVPYANKFCILLDNLKKAINKVEINSDCVEALLKAPLPKRVLDDRFKLKEYQGTPSVLYAGQWHPLSPKAVPLFPGEDHKDKLELKDLILDKAFLRLENPPELEPSATAGFFKLNLSSPNDPFATGLYPDVLNWVTMLNTEAIGRNMIRAQANPDYKTKAKLIPLPKEPYAPILKSIELAYDFDSVNMDPEQLVGKWLYATADEEGKEQLLPDLILYKTAYGSDEKKSDYLYLGFSELQKNDELNLFFGLATIQQWPGSTLEFELWTGQWEPDTSKVDIEVLYDSTYVLSNTGIIKLRINKKPLKGAPEVDSSLYWIRLLLSHPEALNLSLINTNAVLATRVPNDISHHESNLPAESITELVEQLPVIDEVYQPFFSFGFQPAEAVPTFRERVARRLKNKGRAQSISSLQQLVLENFKEVYEVRFSLKSKEESPEVFLVPFIKSSKSPNRYRPIAGKQLREKITAYLEANGPMGVKYTVDPCSLKEIRINTSVKFEEGVDTEALKVALNQAINHYLSPWLDGKERSRKQHHIDSYDLMTFIKSRPGVLSVQGLTVEHLVGEEWEPCTPGPNGSVCIDVGLKVGELLVPDGTNIIENTTSN